MSLGPTVTVNTSNVTSGNVSSICYKGSWPNFIILFHPVKCHVSIFPLSPQSPNEIPNSGMFFSSQRSRDSFIWSVGIYDRNSLKFSQRKSQPNETDPYNKWWHIPSDSSILRDSSLYLSALSSVKSPLHTIIQGRSRLGSCVWVM